MAKGYTLKKQCSALLFFIIIFTISDVIKATGSDFMATFDSLFISVKLV